MTDNLPARVAALELLVEQLILERVMTGGGSRDAVLVTMGELTKQATEREGVPMEAIGAGADILARVMNRLGEE